MYRAAVAILLLANPLLSECRTSLGFGDFQDQPVQHVINKLEAYAVDITNSHDLTIKELKFALADYKKWEKFGLEWSRTLPLYRLLTAVVMKPLDNFLQQFDENPEDVEKAFVQMVVDAYKKFRPAYFGQLIGGGKRKNSPKLKMMAKELLGMSDERITLKQVRLMEMELTEFSNYLHQLELTDDFLVAQKDAMVTLNSLNFPFNKVFIEMVLPHADKIEDPKGLALIRSEYIKGLKGRKTQKKNGKYITDGEVDEL